MSKLTTLWNGGTMRPTLLEEGSLNTSSASEMSAATLYSSSVEQDNPLTCYVCGKHFSRQQYLNSHLKRHQGQLSHDCHTCGKTFPLPGALEKHMRVHEVKCHKCTKCEKTYTKLAQLRIHASTHTGEKPCSCLVCGKCFGKPSAMHRHMKIHTGQKSHVCDICNKRFIQKCNRDSHRKTHIKPKDKDIGDQSDDPSKHAVPLESAKQRDLYSCYLCERSFVTKFDLKTHLKCKKCHDGVDDKCMENCPDCNTPQQCGNCGKVLRSLEALETHMERHHANGNTHMCHICSKPFETSSSLKNHLRSHDDEFQFICDVCGQGFHQSAGLKRHTRVHTGEKPFECPVCERRFSDQSSMKRHTKTHTKHEGEGIASI